MCVYFVVFVIVACERQSEKECMYARCRHYANVYVGIGFSLGAYHCFQSSVESYCVFALALLYCALWLVKKSLRNFLNQSDVKPN